MLDLRAGAISVGAASRPRIVRPPIRSGARFAAGRPLLQDALGAISAPPLEIPPGVPISPVAIFFRR